MEGGCLKIDGWGWRLVINQSVNEGTHPPRVGKKAKTPPEGRGRSPFLLTSPPQWRGGG